MIISAERNEPLAQWREVRAANNLNDSQLRKEDHERAVANIAQWRQFLPADCVDAMIKHGWHRRV